MSSCHGPSCTREAEALRSVADDLACGRLPASTSALFPQVVSRRGWLIRALDALYGRSE